MKTETQYITIQRDHEGRRMDHFLFSRFHHVPKSHLYRLLRSGQIRINKKRISAGYHLKLDDVLRIPPLVLSEEKCIPPISFHWESILKASILYEDDAVLIVNKPSGLAVHGGDGIAIGLIQLMRQLRQDLPYLELVHRIDRETSGCVILAKRCDVLRKLQDLFRERRVKKIYQTLTKGRWSKTLNVIDVPMKKNVLQSGERMVQIDQEGKQAVTIFRVIQHLEMADWVEVEIKTGRTHQIRVHARYAGHPLAGDEKYGDPVFNKLMRQHGLHRLFLHAAHIEFISPDTGKCIQVTAPLDEKLTQLDILRQADYHHSFVQD